MREFVNDLIARLRGLIGDRRGATAIEYAVIASGISFAIIATVWTMGTSIKTNLYDRIAAMF
ncbi:MAG TPA: Flp family type IVb pilin [Pseudolabrys sp.]|jgi:pilus assembly protein Flp/PilA|nr:Flp family type IVb pilin [Pseudolabrys sp.]